MDFNYKWFELGIGITWAIFSCAFVFLVFVVQRRYIVKRYEVETNLAETEKFVDANRLFITMFPFSKAILYSTHLLIVMCRSDKSMNKHPFFKESPSSAEILGHFSKKERVLTAVTGGCAFLCIVFLAIYSLLDWLWSH